MSPARGVLALTTRLVRRGALILAAAGGAYVALEVVSYEQSYPDAASRARLAAFQDNPAVRMMQGIAHEVDTVGGFVAWDGGWFLQVVAAIWAILAVLKLTRGEEDDDRSAFLLTGPVTAARLLVLQVLTVVAGGVLYAAGCVVALAAFGVPPARASLFGLGLLGFVAVAAALGALAAQLLDVRRRAVGIAMGALASCYLLRMAGNSADALGWLRWLTPFGWMDNLRAYGSPSLPALGLLLGAPVLLVAVAARLRARRDAGGAVVTTRDTRAAHVRWLGSPVLFAWRSSRGNLIAWAVGLGAYALLVGSLLPTMSDYLVDEPSFRKVMEQLGIEASDIQRGLVSFMSVMFGLAFALYACWRIGAARGEEESGRAELLLARAVDRRSWLGGHVLLCLGSVVLLALTTGLATWAGGAMVGAEVGVLEALRAALNPVPVALLFVAIPVLVLGLRPRLTVALSASLAGVAYLVPVLGSALDLPSWATAISPFQHLATVPVEPYALTSGVVMTALAVAGTAAGLLLFERRDLAGA